MDKSLVCFCRHRRSSFLPGVTMLLAAFIPRLAHIEEIEHIAGRIFYCCHAARTDICRCTHKCQCLALSGVECINGGKNKGWTCSASLFYQIEHQFDLCARKFKNDCTIALSPCLV